MGQCSLCTNDMSLQIHEPNEAEGQCPSCQRTMCVPCAIPLKERWDQKCSVICKRCHTIAEATNNEVVIRQAANQSTTEEIREAVNDTVITYEDAMSARLYLNVCEMESVGQHYKWRFPADTYPMVHLTNAYDEIMRADKFKRLLIIKNLLRHIIDNGVTAAERPAAKRPDRETHTEKSAVKNTE